MFLINTERCPQQPLDKAASCVLTDRSLPYERASWQQCANCDEWIQDTNLEYTFQCVLGLTPGGSPTVNFELKTRYPAYTCPSCSKAPAPRASTPGNQDNDDDEEAEQLCPLHVQAVYLLRGRRTADNMGAVTKGFILHCPDCGLQSQLLSTPGQVKLFIQQHTSASRRCVRLQRAVASGTYDSAAAFGAAKYNSSVEPEKVIKELLSRLVVMTACHIVSSTRPPPTPIEQLIGDARRAAEVTRHLRRTSRDQSSSEASQQLMPYRSWAVDALSLDSDLLAEANWVRPSLAGIDLEHKPSLLDMVLAPPYIAVAEHDAGMTVDKLAVLLLRQQRRQNGTSFALLMSAVAAGEQLPEAVAAVEAALIDLLSTDAVFQWFPKQQRLELFFEIAGIQGLSDVVYALAQPHVQGRNPHRFYLNVCAVCGMSSMALKRAKRASALHRCKHCIICTCQSCKQEQEEQQPDGQSAAASDLCLWCQGHPDTHGVVLPNKGTNKGRSGSPQNNAAMKGSAEEEEDAAAGSWCQESGPDASLDSQDVDWQLQQQQQKGKSKRKKESKGRGTTSAGTAAVAMPSPVAAVGIAHDGDNDIDRTADGSIYDLVVELATAAAAAGGGGRRTDANGKQQSAAAAPAPAPAVAPVPVAAAESDTKPKPATASNVLDKEIEDLRRMQLELQMAADRLGLQGINVPVLDQQQQQRPAEDSELELRIKRKLSPDTANRRDSNTRPDKRLCQQQQQQQQQSKSPPAVFNVAAKPPLPPAAAAAGFLKERRSILRPSASPSPPLPDSFTAAAAGVNSRGGMHGFSSKNGYSRPALKCGNCDTCRNPHWNKACLAHNKQHVPANGSRVIKCGKCKTCLNPQHKKACLVYHAGKQQNGKQHPESKAMKQQKQGKLESVEDDKTQMTLLADLLLTSAGFQPRRSSSKGSDMHKTAAAGESTAAAGAAASDAASDHVDGTASVSAANVAAGDAACKVKQELSQILTSVGFEPKEAEGKAAGQQETATAAARPVEGDVLGSANGAAEGAAGNQAAASSASTLSETLRHDISKLQEGISSWCEVNSAAEHTDVIKAMQVIQQLQQQLTQSYEETGEQVFVSGLQVLQQIVRTIQQLPDAGCQVLLVQTTEDEVPAAYCPDDRATSVLELLMCCWLKEVQDTGLSVAEGRVAAAQAMTAAALEAAADRKQVVAGLCSQTLDVIERLTAAQQGWSSGASTAANLDAATPAQELRATARQAGVQLIAGASVLLLQWPEEVAAAGDDSSSSSWLKFAVCWRKCLSTCLGLLGDQDDAGAVGSACKDIGNGFSKLLKSVDIEAE